MPKFDIVNNKIKALRNKAVFVTGRERREISREKRDHRAAQRAMRKHDRARFDDVSPMRGNKYGWTFTTVHGGREYRVVGEPCLICGRDHKYHREQR